MFVPEHPQEDYSENICHSEHLCVENGRTHTKLSNVRLYIYGFHDGHICNILNPLEQERNLKTPADYLLIAFHIHEPQPDFALSQAGLKCSSRLA